MFGASHRQQSVFQIDGSGASTSRRSNRRRIEAWRGTASFVWMCWEELLASPPERRARAYAALGAALDAEAAAAEDIATSVAAGPGGR
jgi:hypothetical protein